MVAVILLLQPLLHLFRRTAVVHRHVGNGLREVAVDLFLRDAAQRLVTSVHADVLRLVETAEHAHLRELRHARQQHELQMLVCHLEYRVKGFQHVAVMLLQHRVNVEHVQNRFVVLVDKDHGATPRLLMGGFEHSLKTSSQVQPVWFRSQTVVGFPACHIAVQTFLQCVRFCEVTAIEVQMKHRINVPCLFHAFYLQPLEQFLTAKIIVLQRRDKQALAETAGTAQEVDAALVRQAVYQVGLVHVDVTVFDNAVETLNANGIFHVGSNE